MLASEYIQRLQDLISANGDVEVVILKPESESLYESAGAESVNVVPVDTGENIRDIWSDEFMDGDERVITLITVW